MITTLGGLAKLEDNYGELIPYAELFSSYDENQEAVNIYNDGIDQSRPGETETLDPKSLVATQEDLSTAGLRHYLKGTGRSAEEKPVVIRYGGKTYLIDGHHRAGAAILKGESLTVEVYNAEKLLPEMFGRLLGGPGSGNFGHAGRPGQIGGSAPQDLPAADRAALDSYGFARTGRVINNMLRNGEIGNFAHKQGIAKTLDRLMVPGEPLTVYRALPTHVIQGMNVGDTFIDKGFTSTTKDLAATSQFMERFKEDGEERRVASIRVPAEAPRLDTTKYSPSKAAFTVENNEVILPRDTVFQIVSTDPLEIRVKLYVDDKGSSWSPMSNSVLKDMLDAHPERSPAAAALLKELKRRAKKGDTHAKQVHDETVTRFRAAKAPEKPSIQFNKVNKRAAAWARKHAAELVTDISETSRKRIKQAIAKLIEGEDYSKVLALIDKAVGDDDRAMLIAHHETMAAVSAGQREAWREAQEEELLPDNIKRVWIITPINACPDCEALDGAVADINGLYPDGSVGPPRHPRCRCTEGLI